MKLKYILILFLFVLPEFVFAQYYNYLTYGFNTMELRYFEDGEEKTQHAYYLLNNQLYTNCEISEPLDIDYNWNGIRYEIPSRIPVSRPNGYRVDLVRIMGDGGYTHAWNEDSRTLPDMSIKEVSPGAIVRKFEDGTIEKYYDLPVPDLEHIYLTVFIRNIFTYLRDDSIDYLRHSYNGDTRYRGKDTVWIFIMLPYLKKHELAIIRNCLFAKHRYNFQMPYWKELFGKYYSIHYNGIYTNSKVMEQLTDDEKWFLELILEYENKS
jgi:hypothetical protein